MKAAPSVHCPSCGESLEAGDAFCGNCGKPIPKPAPPPPVQPAKAQPPPQAAAVSAPQAMPPQQRSARPSAWTMIQSVGWFVVVMIVAAGFLMKHGILPAPAFAKRFLLPGVVVPNLSNCTNSAAMQKALLQAGGLTAEFVDAKAPAPTKEMEFKFAGQSPAAGTSAVQGDVVRISLYGAFVGFDPKPQSAVMTERIPPPAMQPAVSAVRPADPLPVPVPLPLPPAPLQPPMPQPQVFGIPIPTPPAPANAEGSPLQSLWLFPDSSTRLLSQQELSTLDADGLWRARNEIYARAGLIFSTERGKAFGTWLGAAYRGIDPDQDRVFNRMSPTEQLNIEHIKSLEQNPR